jgi:hypothetical protein
MRKVIRGILASTVAASAMLAMALIPATSASAINQVPCGSPDHFVMINNIVKPAFGFCFANEGIMSIFIDRPTVTYSGNNEVQFWAVGYRGTNLTHWSGREEIFYWPDYNQTGPCCNQEKYTMTMIYIW